VQLLYHPVLFYQVTGRNRINKATQKIRELVGTTILKEFSVSLSLWLNGQVALLFK